MIIKKSDDISPIAKLNIAQRISVCDITGEIVTLGHNFLMRMLTTEVSLKVFL